MKNEILPEITKKQRNEKNEREKSGLVKATRNKPIRFPNDIIKDVEEAIKGKECTFSAFVIAAVRNALEELEEK